MDKILFVTQTLGFKAACGVGLYGKLWADTLVDLEKYKFIPLFTDSLEETIDKIREIQPVIVIYNFHNGTSQWMSHSVLRQTFPNVKHVGIHHDMVQSMINNFDTNRFGGFDYYIIANPSVTGNDQVFVVNKLLPSGPTIPYVESQLPIIGYQGFGFGHKGIARLAQQVNQEFDKCLFRLHIPYSWFEDRDGHQTAQRVAEIRSLITKPGIKLEFSHDLIDTQELVDWLSQNTINCYLYDFPYDAGLASAPDYALAARRPIAVSRNHMMKHFHSLQPSVVLDDSSIKQIIANGTAPLEPLYRAYSKESFLSDWTNVLTRILSK
jgi:hypothetical protein